MFIIIVFYNYNLFNFLNLFKLDNDVIGLLFNFRISSWKQFILFDYKNFNDLNLLLHSYSSHKSFNLYPNIFSNLFLFKFNFLSLLTYTFGPKVLILLLFN